MDRATLIAELIGFKYFSDEFTYATYRWVFNVEAAKRREILFCIILYFEVPNFKKELDCIETFLKNFTFDIDEEIKEATETSKKQDFDEVLFQNMYGKIERLLTFLKIYIYTWFNVEIDEEKILSSSHSFL